MRNILSEKKKKQTYRFFVSPDQMHALISVLKWAWLYLKFCPAFSKFHMDYLNWEYLELTTWIFEIRTLQLQIQITSFMLIPIFYKSTKEVFAPCFYTFYEFAD